MSTLKQLHNASSYNSVMINQFSPGKKKYLKIHYVGVIFLGIVSIIILLIVFI